MTDILVAVIVFGLIFGGALFGMFLGSVLPDQHLSPEARDVIRIVMAMLATLSAVVLGLLTGSAISSLAEKECELRNAGVQFILLDRTLAAYGPETKNTRDLLKQVLAERISQIWPEEGGNVSLDSARRRRRDRPGSAGPLRPVAADRSTAMAPVQRIGDHQERSANRAGRPSSRSAAGSRGRFLSSWCSGWRSSLPVSASSPRAMLSVTAALFVAALGLAGAIFMILEMDQPYRGVVKIPSTSLRIALDQLGRS